MNHVFFFSYATANLDPDMEGFLDDLRKNVAPFTDWGNPDDPRVCFRDRDNLKLMQEWGPEISKALQTSSVFVCLVSPAYYNRRFCGQEYHLFEQRAKRQSAMAGKPIHRILPVLWVYGGGQSEISGLQWHPSEMSASARSTYEKKGLLRLKKTDPDAYQKYLIEFADAIVSAAEVADDAPSVPDDPAMDFDELPNKFLGGRMEEAIGGDGLLIKGPGVANFVFAAGEASQLTHVGLPGRYGKQASEWKPYLPAETKSVSELASAAAKKHSLKYREIPVNSQLCDELTNAKNRKNLTLIFADPVSLTNAQCADVGVYDTRTWDGSALMMLLDDTPVLKPGTLQSATVTLFPMVSQLAPPKYSERIRSAADLEKLLDNTFADLQNDITKAGIGEKQTTDQPPPQLTATVAAAPPAGT
ncbi:MAG: toll/interleukin-1 receptor domain-containing protein [Gemmatimonadaceae bacterium]